MSTLVAVQHLQGPEAEKGLLAHTHASCPMDSPSPPPAESGGLQTGTRGLTPSGVSLFNLPFVLQVICNPLRNTGCQEGAGAMSATRIWIGCGRVPGPTQEGRPRFRGPAVGRLPASSRWRAPLHRSVTSSAGRRWP